jgi:hypothetical protein
MPIAVEVIAYIPTGFFHCTHCEVVFREIGLGPKVHREQLDSGVPDDLQRTLTELTGWLEALQHRHGDRIALTVVDAVSLQGFYASLRHRVRRYPAIIIDGAEAVAGGDYARAEALLEARLGAVAG